VNLEAEGAFRTRPDEIERFYVRTAQGQMVPLSTVVTIEPVSGPQFTTRFNLFRAAEITGAPSPGHSSGDAMAAVEAVAAKTLPKEMTLGWAGMSYQEKHAGGVGGVLVLSLLLVFLVLAAQYESLSLPLAIILIVPMCLLPAVTAVKLDHGDNNIFMQIGLLVLVGLACKNAILIVEFAKHLQEEHGRDAKAAVLEAAHLRLRPILMTSMAFVMGVVPLVVAFGAGAEVRHALGVTVFAGMLGVTAFGLLLTPVFYVFVRRATAHAAPAPMPPLAVPETEA
jgi:multidrug efflux pump